MFGVESFDAILPPGSAAILAVGGSKPVVTVDENGRIGVEKQVGAEGRGCGGAVWALMGGGGRATPPPPHTP